MKFAPESKEISGIGFLGINSLTDMEKYCRKKGFEKIIIPLSACLWWKKYEKMLLIITDIIVLAETNPH